MTLVDDLIAALPQVVAQPEWLVLSLTLLGGFIFGCGVRRQQFGFRTLGVLIQLISLYFFLNSVWYPFSASILKNTYFFNCFIIALTAMVSAYMLEKWLVGGMKQWDQFVYAVLFLLGGVAWYVGGLREIYMHIVLFERLSGVLLFVSATSILIGLVAENIGWEKLNRLLLIQLPAMVVLLLLEYFGGGESFSLLTGWGTTVWPITFFIQFRILTVLDDLNWSSISSIYHLVSLWLLLLFCSREITIVTSEMSLSPLVHQSVQPLFACLVIVFLVALKKLNLWPVRLFPGLYLWGGTAGVIVLLLFSVVPVTG